MPANIEELIWYGFGLLATYFLWSINGRLKDMNEKIDTEANLRSALSLEVAGMRARCDERHGADRRQHYE